MTRLPQSGLTGKYHATVIMAFLSLIAERMARDGAGDAQSFIEQNPDLLEAGVLDRYYAPERLGSPLARQVF